MAEFISIKQILLQLEIVSDHKLETDLVVFYIYNKLFKTYENGNVTRVIRTIKSYMELSVNKLTGLCNISCLKVITTSLLKLISALYLCVCLGTCFLMGSRNGRCVIRIPMTVMTIMSLSLCTSSWLGRMHLISSQAVPFDGPFKCNVGTLL